MRILALDFGSITGFAVGSSTEPPVSGTWKVAPLKGESPGFRYIHLRKKLNTVLEAFPDLKIAVAEMAHMRGGAASEYAIGCATTLQAWCAEHGIEYTTVHSATLKKWATGHGHASKEEMIAAAIKKGWKPVDDNEADALHLLDYAINEVVGK